MSLLTVCRTLALNVGMPTPDVIATSSEREWAEALQMANEAGEELARRVDWGMLNRTTVVFGDGVTQAFTMPADFDRLTMGITVRAGRNVVRSLTQGEWAGLGAATGIPRYFKLDDTVLRLWPVPVIGTEVSISYISREWLIGAASYSADADTALLDENILAKCLIVRWRRQKGMPYADEEAEFEAALVDRAKFDDRGRL